MIHDAQPFDDVLSGEFEQNVGFETGQFFILHDVASLLEVIRIVTEKNRMMIANIGTISH